MHLGRRARGHFRSKLKREHQHPEVAARRALLGIIESTAQFRHLASRMRALDVQLVGIAPPAGPSPDRRGAPVAMRLVGPRMRGAAPVRRST